jgi:DNA polymerase III delta prime subunit
MSLFIKKYQPVELEEFQLDKDTSELLNCMIQNDDMIVLLFGESSKTSLLNALVNKYYQGISPKVYNDSVLYINSLKEQGVNYYRTDVKLFCQSKSGIPGKKKIVVLDDVDLINEQSQQVFRNCIDKYGANVHFIASCNNIQKVISSVQSRMIVIKLKPIEKHIVYGLVRKIIASENLIVHEEAIDYLYALSNGNIKIIVNYLENIKLLAEPIDIQKAKQITTNINEQLFDDYCSFLKSGKLREAIKLLYDIYDQGYSVMDILDSLFSFVKKTPSLDEDTKYKVVALICKYITMFHEVHEDEIELALFTNNFISIVC